MHPTYGLNGRPARDKACARLLGQYLSVIEGIVKIHILRVFTISICRCDISTVSPYEWERRDSLSSPPYSITKDNA